MRVRDHLLSACECPSREEEWPGARIVLEGSMPPANRRRVRRRGGGGSTAATFCPVFAASDDIGSCVRCYRGPSRRRHDSARVTSPHDLDPPRSCFAFALS